MKSIITLALVLLFHSTAYAEIFKCTKGDEVAYQAIPCDGANKKIMAETVAINVKTTSTETETGQCETSCSTNTMTCRSKLKFGNYNSDGGLQVCAALKTSCEAECNEQADAKALKLHYLKLKSAYANTLRSIESEKNTIEKNKQLAKKAADKEEKTRRSCILRETTKVEKIYQPNDQLDASERRRYKSALEAVEKNC